MRLELGKGYSNRNGELVKIVSISLGGAFGFGDAEGLWYAADGSYYDDGDECELDLVSEVGVETVPAAVDPLRFQLARDLFVHRGILLHLAFEQADEFLAEAKRQGAL